jgi:hypothetical protein
MMMMIIITIIGHECERGLSWRETAVGRKNKGKDTEG